MRTIRKATNTDIDAIKKIYEWAFCGMEGLIQKHFKFENMWNFFYDISLRMLQWRRMLYVEFYLHTKCRI